MFVAWFSFMLSLWVAWWLAWAFQGTLLGSRSSRTLLFTLSQPFFRPWLARACGNNFSVLDMLGTSEADFLENRSVRSCQLPCASCCTLALATACGNHCPARFGTFGTLLWQLCCASKKVEDYLLRIVGLVAS